MTVAQAMAAAGSCWTAKKGARYVCVRNGELALTSRQDIALAYPTSRELEHAIMAACVDDRNARVIGASYKLVQLSRVSAN